MIIETLRHSAHHLMNVCYNAMHQFGVPGRWIPDAFLALVAVVLTVWLVLHVLVGRLAQNKGQSFWYGFLFALLTTPVIASLFIAFLRPIKTAKRPSRKRTPFAPAGRGRERVA